MHELIKDFLIECKYIYQKQTAKDIETALDYFVLEIQIQEYSYSDGSVKSLISLESTVSVNKVPIQIYLSDYHPYSAPTCFVRPTSSMSIKSSSDVDTTGLIHIDWEPETSDLVLLLNIISMKFNENSPVLNENSVRMRSPKVNEARVKSSQTRKQSEEEENILPQVIRSSIISTIQDKARDKLNELESIKQAEIEYLKRVNRGLVKSELIINGLIEEANFQIDDLKELTHLVKSETLQLNKDVNLLKCRDESSLEDAVVTAPLYRQIMQLFTEDLAILDMIYYLKVGLQHKTISLDVFLKQIRVLSRKQFMLRATLFKAKQIANG